LSKDRSVALRRTTCTTSNNHYYTPQSYMRVLLDVHARRLPWQRARPETQKKSYSQLLGLKVRRKLTKTKQGHSPRHGLGVEICPAKRSDDLHCSTAGVPPSTCQTNLWPAKKPCDNCTRGHTSKRWGTKGERNKTSHRRSAELFPLKPTAPSSAAARQPAPACGSSPRCSRRGLRTPAGTGAQGTVRQTWPRSRVS